MCGTRRGSGGVFGCREDDVLAGEDAVACRRRLGRSHPGRRRRCEVRMHPVLQSERQDQGRSGCRERPAGPARDAAEGESPFVTRCVGTRSPGKVDSGCKSRCRRSGILQQHREARMPGRLRQPRGDPGALRRIEGTGRPSGDTTGIFRGKGHRRRQALVQACKAVVGISHRNHQNPSHATGT